VGCRPVAGQPALQRQPGAAASQRQPLPQAHGALATGAVDRAASPLQPQGQSAAAQSTQGQRWVEGTFMAISWMIRTRRIRATNSVHRSPIGLEQSG